MPNLRIIPQQLTEMPGRATETGAGPLRRGLTARGGVDTGLPGAHGLTFRGAHFSDLVRPLNPTGPTAAGLSGTAASISGSGHNQLNLNKFSDNFGFGTEILDQPLPLQAAIASTSLATTPGTAPEVGAAALSDRAQTASAELAAAAAATVEARGSLDTAALTPLTPQSVRALPSGQALPPGGSQLPPTATALESAAAAMSTEPASLATDAKAANLQTAAEQPRARPGREVMPANASVLPGADQEPVPLNSGSAAGREPTPGDRALGAQQTGFAQNVARLLTTASRDAVRQPLDEGSITPSASSPKTGMDLAAGRPGLSAGSTFPGATSGAIPGATSGAIPGAMPADMPVPSAAVDAFGIRAARGERGAIALEAAAISADGPAAASPATNSGRAGLMAAPTGSSAGAAGFSQLSFAGASQVDTDALSGMLNHRIGMLVRNGVQSARVQLAPEHLGLVDVRIQIAEEGASVTFATQTMPARDALEASLPRLRELFADQGLNLTDASVSSGDEHAAHQGARDRTAQASPVTDATLPSAATDPLTSAPTVTRGDRLVDLFV